MRAVLNQKIFPNRIISNLKKEAAFFILRNLPGELRRYFRGKSFEIKILHANASMPLLKNRRRPY